jgi:hypothetical protein
MTFDRDDIQAMAGGPNDYLLASIILHEMGHVLGVGVTWDNLGLLSGECLVDPIFTGPDAIAAFNAAGGTLYSGDPVPVEDTGKLNDGSNCSHWRESVFNNELMTPYIDAGSNPLSAVTVESLGDMGYTVDAGAADAYQLPKPVPAGQAPAFRSGLFLRNDRLPIPLRRKGPDGRVRLVGGRR